MSRMPIPAGRWVDLSIPLDPHGPQPSAYGVAPATARPYSGDGFTLDTRLGGACNCEVLTLTTHGNGTHTESVGHITRERFPLAAAQLPLILSCAVVTLTPTGRQIHAEHLTSVPLDTEALVVRTLPNGSDKRTRQWQSATTPYFMPEAIVAIRACGVQHLLVDLPSLDPLVDGGALAAHRAFWDMPAGSQQLPGPAARRRTVTELIYVPDEIPDGRYQLMIQVPNIISDAVPSRPLLLFSEDSE